MSNDDELPRGPQKPLGLVTPIRDRGLELRRRAVSLSEGKLPSVDRLRAAVEQRQTEGAVERSQSEVERKGSLIHAIHLDLEVTRKQAAGPEADDISKSHDDLTPPVGSIQFRRAGSKDIDGTRVVHPFDSDTFQELSTFEKLLALNELEARFSAIEHRPRVAVVPISDKDASHKGWKAEEMTRYVHDELPSDRTIVIRSDLLEAKDERDLLLRVFQKQKEAEQHAFRERFAQQNYHSETDAKRMEMMQNALATSKGKTQTNEIGTLSAENPLEKERREYAVELLRAYELYKVRSG